MTTLTRADLAAAVYEASDPGSMSRDEAADFADGVLAEIANALVAGDTVKVPNFGKFSPRRMAARTGRNPKRPEEARAIPAQKRVVFRASRKLKETVKLQEIGITYRLNNRTSSAG